MSIAEQVYAALRRAASSLLPQDPTVDLADWLDDHQGEVMGKALALVLGDDPQHLDARQEAAVHLVMADLLANGGGEGEDPRDQKYAWAAIQTTAEHLGIPLEGGIPPGLRLAFGHEAACFYAVNRLAGLATDLLEIGIAADEDDDEDNLLGWDDPRSAEEPA